MEWKEHEFEIPLGIELPDIVISADQDWIDDCEIDEVFGLQPCYYTSKNKYDAALKLCRICSGWFYFENNDEKEIEISLVHNV